jgi:excisionase family DNA binding protein
LEGYVLTVADVQKYLGISKNLAYSQIRAGTIPSIRLGRKVLVPRAAFEEWLKSTGGNEARIAS